MTARAYSAFVDWVTHSRYGRVVGAVVALTVLHGLKRLTPSFEDYIDPSWQRHEGLLRAAHPKVDGTIGVSYGGSDTTPQTDDQPPAEQSGAGVSDDVVLAIDWVKRNPGIGLTHFHAENHRHRLADGDS